MWIKDNYTAQVEQDAASSERKAQEAIIESENVLKTQKHLRAAARKERERLEAELAKKDAEILEWMHTNAAFRKLTKDYAARFGVSEEERVRDVDQARVDIAIEDPAFQHTELYKKSLALVEKHKSE